MNVILRSDYQNTEYKATNKATTMSDPIAKEVGTLNILASISNPFGTIPLLFSIMLIIYMPITATVNTISIRSMNGIS